MTDQGRDRPGDQGLQGPHPGWARALFRLSPWGLRRSIERLQVEAAQLSEVVHGRLAALDGRLAALDSQLAAIDGRLAALESSLAGTASRLGGVDGRLDRVDERLAIDDQRRQSLERRLDGAEENLRTFQAELAALRDERTLRLERRVDAVGDATAAAAAEAARLRDIVVPAAVARGNVLVDRLAEQIEEVSSLVERMLLSEPLAVPGGPSEGRLARTLAGIQPRLLEAFRGPEDEIRHRLDHHLAVLAGAAPVLDLGCGRGELLLLLREAGVAARGVEPDPALAQAARRRGLEVFEGNAIEALESEPASSWGAVTAIHLLEHLEPAELLELLAAARRALRPGGLLLAECPNPHSLRVGATLFWRDPTHRRPLPPETLELFLKASGFEVRSIEYLHPFPDEQRLTVASGTASAGLPADLAPLAGVIERLSGRLDELINGARDFAIVAARPAAE